MDEKNGQQVVGRLAPTPSGRMHLGNAFSALLAWASVRTQAGRLVLRIEDLDPRARDAAVARQLADDLRWLGIDWDEGPYFQSTRTDIYLDAIARLQEMGLTYPCFCTRAELHAATAPHASDGTFVYQGTCRHLTAAEVAEKSARRPPATRLVVPDASNPASGMSFNDRTYGPYRENLARDCGDFLIRRSDGVVAYQLAVVVDDGLMGVTEVVRGRDLLPSAARQSYLAGLLGFTPPAYAHVPLLTAPDGRRLSKRDHDLGLDELRQAGVGAPQVIGFLAHLIGLAEPGEALDANAFLSRFSWAAVREHADDIVLGGRAAMSLHRAEPDSLDN